MSRVVGFVLSFRPRCYPSTKWRELLDECNQLCNIIARSIVTTKENKKKAQSAAAGSR